MLPPVSEAGAPVLASTGRVQVPAAACSAVQSGWAAVTVSAANAGAVKANNAADPIALVLSNPNFFISFSPIEKPDHGCRLWNW